MDQAFASFERIFLYEKRCPELSFFRVQGYSKNLNFFETGVCYPLSGRDEEGRRIVLVQSRKWNPERYCFYDLVRLFLFVCAVLCEEEETQIAGIIFIFDHADVSMKQIPLLVQIKDVVGFLNNTVGRNQGAYNLNLPSFANFLLETSMAAMCEKLKKRIFVLKGLNDLGKYINPALLPKECGGIITEAQMMEDFKKLRDEKIDMMMTIQQMEIDWNKVPLEKKSKAESIGSFRKLELD